MLRSSRAGRKEAARFHMSHSNVASGRKSTENVPDKLFARKETARFHLAGNAARGRTSLGSAAENAIQARPASTASSTHNSSTAIDSASGSPSAVASSSKVPLQDTSDYTNVDGGSGLTTRNVASNAILVNQSGSRRVRRASAQNPNASPAPAKIGGPQSTGQDTTSGTRLAQSYEATVSESSEDRTHSGQTSPPTTHSLEHSRGETSGQEKEQEEKSTGSDASTDAESDASGVAVNTGMNFRELLDLALQESDSDGENSWRSYSPIVHEHPVRWIQHVPPKHRSEWTPSPPPSDPSNAVEERAQGSRRAKRNKDRRVAAIDEIEPSQDSLESEQGVQDDVIMLSPSTMGVGIPSDWGFSQDDDTSIYGEVGPSAPRRSAYRPHEPREIPGGDSLVANRAPRAGRKSLKQIEAEESGADGHRRRRSKSDNQTSISASSSAPAALTVAGRTYKARGTRANATSSNTPTALVLRAATGQASADKQSLDKKKANIETDDQVRRRSSRFLSEPHAESPDPHSPLTRSSSPATRAESVVSIEQPVRRNSVRAQHKARSDLRTHALDRAASVTSASGRSILRKQPPHSVDGEASVDSTSGRGAYASDDVASATGRLLTRSSKQPSWKKKVFLNSGLYSDDFKMDADSSQTSQQGKHAPVKGKNPSKGPLLPLPTDFGYWKLVEKRDFRLPFPIAQEIEDIRAKLATKRKPQPYKHISTNRYVSRAKLPGEIMVCQCPPSGNCGDSCVNRQTEYLCHPKHCPCGERCTNIQFGKRKPIKTEVKWYGSRGFGLRTLEAIPKDSFIDEYRGEVISYNEMVRRVRDHYKAQGNYYFLMYDAPAGEMLDGGLKGNITRFANHSCDPNCKIQKWLVCGTDEARAGEFQVALFAARDIAAGEELTYDYGWSAFSPKSVAEDGSTMASEPCHCGAANCSGFMGVKKSAVLPKSAERAAEKPKAHTTRRKSQPRKSAASQDAAAAAVFAAGREARAPSTPAKLLPLHKVATTSSASLPASKSVDKAIARPELSSVVTPNSSKASQRPPSSSGLVSEPTQKAPPSSKEGDKASQSSTPRDNGTKRIPVKDRVTFAWTTAEPANLIDSNKVPIVTGKRQRNPIIDPRSLIEDAPTMGARPAQASPQKVKRRRVTTDGVPSSQVDATKPAEPNKEAPKRIIIGASLRARRSYQDLIAPPAASSPVKGTSPSSHPSSGSTSGAIPAGASQLLAGDEDVPFDFSKHPPGTKFFTRAGKPFDFSRLLEKRRGQRPRVYTAEELKFAQDRHRASVAKANRVRRAKLKARRTM